MLGGSICDLVDMSARMLGIRIRHGQGYRAS
jgi:hypothetical protein